MNFVCQFCVWWIDRCEALDAPFAAGNYENSIRGPHPFANNSEASVVAAAPKHGSVSLKGPVDSRFVQQFRHALACVEHARLDGVLGHAEHPGDFLDRFFLIVRKLDDFAMNA